MYGSAIFYNINILDADYQNIFYFNPLYVYITFIREIVIYNQLPDIRMIILCGLYAIISIVIGLWIYKKYNYKFVYYI